MRQATAAAAVIALLLSVLSGARVETAPVTNMIDMAVTAPVTVAPADFSLLALSWTAPEPPAVRVRSDGAWGSWTAVEPDELSGDQPDRDGRTYSEPIWVDRADAVEVHRSVSLDDLRLHLAVEGTVHRIVNPEAGAATAVDPRRPAIHGRAEWGARPPRQTRYFDGPPRRVIVHHTATTNRYGPADVARQLRAIQAYHMDTRGWWDIAYNFVVDRYGRLWEARGGGVDRSVRGGHTKGFNTGSVGIAALGDFRASPPPDAMVTALGTLSGWRLRIAGVHPKDHGRARSYGSDKYPAGTVVDLPAVSAHRDTGHTTCPGAHLYGALDRVRQIAVATYPPLRYRVDEVVGGELSLSVHGWAFQESFPEALAVDISVDGIVHRVWANRPRPDVARHYPAAGLNRGYALQVSAWPGRRDVCVVVHGRDGLSWNWGCRTVDVGPALVVPLASSA